MKRLLSFFRHVKRRVYIFLLPHLVRFSRLVGLSQYGWFSPRNLIEDVVYRIEELPPRRVGGKYFPGVFYLYKDLGRRGDPSVLSVTRSDGMIVPAHRVRQTFWYWRSMR